MFNQQSYSPLDKPPVKTPIKDWLPYIIGMTATAIISTIGHELVKWGVDELKHKYGKAHHAKKNKDDNTNKPNV